MRRVPFWMMCVLSFSSCGLIFDGAYLLSDKTTVQSVEQRRPTDQTQTAPEARLRFDSNRVGVVCESVTRSVDRVWNVQKTYEYQGGWPYVHWVPVFLEGLIGAGSAIGIGVKCADPTSNISCDLLYATIPLGVDVIYSMVRALTIEPPKLTNKTLTEPRSDMHGGILNSSVSACEPNTELVATARGVSGPLRLHVEANGWIGDEEQIALLTFLLGRSDALIAVYSGSQQLMPELNRCEFFIEQNAANPSRGIPADCQPR